MKTYNQFLNTPFSEEIAPPEPQEEDPGIKSKEKRQSQIKKMVLMKKLQAVRAGSGADIVAGYEPKGEVIDERQKTNQGERQSQEAGRSDYGKMSVRNTRKFGKPGEPAVFDLPFSGGHSERGKMITQRRKEGKEKRGVKKVKGMKEDKAFNFVLDKIKKEVGKDGYVSKDNPRKKQTDAEKAKVRAHQAKLAKQDGRDETEKASDMRYNDRSRSD